MADPRLIPSKKFKTVVRRRRRAVPDYSRLGAIELQREIDQAKGGELRAALLEVERLRGICRDIIETINTDFNFLSRQGSPQAGIDKIEGLAQRYFLADPGRPVPPHGSGP